MDTGLIAGIGGGAAALALIAVLVVVNHRRRAAAVTVISTAEDEEQADVVVLGSPAVTTLPAGPQPPQVHVVTVAAPQAPASSAPQVAPQGESEEFDVEAGPGKLGLFWNRGSDTISEVTPGSQMEGKIQVGDKLLSVNGVSLEGKVYQAIIDAIPTGGKRVFRVSRTAQNASLPAAPEKAAAPQAAPPPPQATAPPTPPQVITATTSLGGQASLAAFLEQHSIASLMPQLAELGVETPEDLSLLNEASLATFKPIHRTKLVNARATLSVT